jgi:hypothetical protein
MMAKGEGRRRTARAGLEGRWQRATVVISVLALSPIAFPSPRLPSHSSTTSHLADAIPTAAAAVTS